MLGGVGLRAGVSLEGAGSANLKREPQTGLEGTWWTSVGRALFENRLIGLAVALFGNRTY
jgi:hypothetical protein